MSRVFVGVGRTDPTSGSYGCDVYVEQKGEWQRLTRKVRRADKGYGWDQAGPRSTELARAILWVVTGEEPPWALYRGFASDVVAHLPIPLGEGVFWRLGEEDVRTWLHDVGWLPSSERGELAEGGEMHAALPRGGSRAIETWKERARQAAAIALMQSGLAFLLARGRIGRRV